MPHICVGFMVELVRECHKCGLVDARGRDLSIVAPCAERGIEREKMQGAEMGGKRGSEMEFEKLRAHLWFFGRWSASTYLTKGRLRSPGRGWRPGSCRERVRVDGRDDCAGDADMLTASVKCT